jgi:hypothetical protein
MKNFLIACGFVLSFSCVLDAQILATTSEGDTVLLKSDGTWDYLRDAEVAEEVLPVNPEKFSTPKAKLHSNRPKWMLMAC